MPLEIYFEPDGIEKPVILAHLEPGELRAIMGFIACIPLVKCNADDSGGFVIFVDQDYLGSEDEAIYVSYNFAEDFLAVVDTSGQIEKRLEHREWEDGQFVALHNRIDVDLVQEP